MVEVTVKTLDSQNYKFEVDNNWTVKQFKEHIQSTVNVPSGEQRLIFCGRVLQDDVDLNEYKCNGKVIHLVRRPPPSEQTYTGSSTESANNNSANPEGTMGSIRIIGENGVFFNTSTLLPDANLSQVLGHLSSTLQRAFGESVMSIPVGSSIGVTISPQFGSPLLSTNPIRPTFNYTSNTQDAAQPINLEGQPQSQPQTDTTPQPRPETQSTTNSTQTSNNPFALFSSLLQATVPVSTVVTSQVHSTASTSSSIPNPNQTLNNPPQSSTSGRRYGHAEIVHFLESRHPEWIPVIEADIKTMEQQNR